jgi:hypothetical protein
MSVTKAKILKDARKRGGYYVDVFGWRITQGIPLSNIDIPFEEEWLLVLTTNGLFDVCTKDRHESEKYPRGDITETITLPITPGRTVLEVVLDELEKRPYGR